MSKKKQELTPWFPASVKPARSGWYQASSRVHDAAPRRYFNGRRWSFCVFPGESDEYAETAKENRSQSQDYYWRGLAKKP